MSTPNCKSILDLTSLEYISVIPKDIQRLVEKELVSDWVLCKFVNRLYREHTSMRYKYLKKDVVVNDLLKIIHYYFGNPLNFEGIKKLIRDHASGDEHLTPKDIEQLILGYLEDETIPNNKDDNNSNNDDNVDDNGDDNGHDHDHDNGFDDDNDDNDSNNDDDFDDDNDDDSDGDNDDITLWNSLNQELIGVQWDLYNILNLGVIRGGDDYQKEMMKYIQADIIYFILEEIYRTDPEMRPILLEISHPLFVKIYSYFLGSLDKLSICDLYSMTEYVGRFVDHQYEKNLIDNLYKQYKTLTTKHPKKKDFTDEILNFKSWEEEKSNRISRFSYHPFSEMFFDEGFDYVDQKDVKRIKRLIKLEGDKIRPIIEKMVRMYYLNEAKKLYPEMLINPSFDFLNE